MTCFTMLAKKHVKAPDPPPLSRTLLFFPWKNYKNKLIRYLTGKVVIYAKTCYQSKVLELRSLKTLLIVEVHSKLSLIFKQKYKKD